MKTYKCKLIILISVLLGVFFVACEDQVFDKTPKNSFSENDVWSNVSLAAHYLTSAYPGIGKWGVGGNDNDDYDDAGPRNTSASLTDDAMQRGNHGLWAYNTGEISPSNLGAANRWQWNYRNIRRTNIFLDKIDKVPDASENEEQVKTLKAIARYIRASCYADLVNWYSWWEGENNGVPLITKPFELGDDFNVQRASYNDVLSFIVSELDTVKENLPQNWPDDQWGKPTKGAAMALKARQLLYAASKLHNPEDNTDAWQKASDAAKAVIDMGEYHLIESVNTYKDYAQIWLNRGNSEIILARSFDPQYLPKNWIDKMNSPNGYTGWGGNTPTQDLVDTYEMQNGKKIDDANSGYDPQNPYENRELRFYADIIYNGRDFRGRKVESFYPAPDSPNVTAGLDSRSSSIQPWNSSPTGYWMYKFMDESIDFAKTSSNVSLIIFRLPEIYLNYAEAQYHLGNEATAKKFVNKVRTRANLPALTSSGSQLLKDIKYERRVEFVGEGNLRWCDVRRWKVLDQTAAKDAVAMVISKHKNGSLTYKRQVAQDRNFDSKMYSLPIPFEEIQKSKLKQNPGY